MAVKTTLFCALGALTLASSVRADGTLAEEIAARSAASAEKTPEATKIAYAAGIKAVEESGIVKSAKQTGDKAPDFKLKNAAGEELSLSGMLKKGPVVLTWYRGGWCPYCNLTLHALGQRQAEFAAAGAQVVALTPELPDKTAATAAKNDVKFTILTDLNHKVAREYGVVFTLTPEVRDLYGKFFSMADFNGADAGDDQLPLAATYIIGQDGVIRYAFLDADYKKRAEPAGLVKFVNENKAALTAKP